MKSFFAILLIVVTSVFTQAQQTGPSYPVKIPTFQFQKMIGEGKFNSANIKKNKKTLIGFVSPDCIHCILSIEHLNNNIDYLKNINVIMVTEYDKDVFMNKFNSIAPNFKDIKSLEVLQDTNYEFIELFNTQSLPTYYLYDKNGNLETVKRGSVEINQIFEHLK